MLMSSLLRAQPPDHVVISEFATGSLVSGQDEFVELYNPTENDILLGGWKLQYKTSASGSVWQDRAILPMTAYIPARGFFLIANTYYAGSVTPDYTSSTWTSLNGISSLGNLRIVDDSGMQVDKVGYGNVGTNDPEGFPAPDQGGTNNNSVERKAFASSTAESLAVGGIHFLAGNGYDSDNNATDFVRQTGGRRPQNSFSQPEPVFGSGGNGTGRVSVSPSKVYSRFPTVLSFNVVADSGYTLTRVKVIIPATWSWSHDTVDVSMTGTGFDSASVTIIGDTIDIANAALTYLNSGNLTVSNMTSPSNGGTSVFRCITGVEGGAPAQILILPVVTIIPIVPIVNLHINTGMGVAAAPYGVGAIVGLTGTVTANVSATQTNVFIQDATGGINLFSFDRPIDYLPGDSVVLTGSILQFRGLTEVVPDPLSVVKLATGRLLPEPLVLTCADVNATFQPDFTEPNEGRLIRINAVSYNSSAQTITDATGTTDIFIPNSFPPTPTLFDVIGILKQFKPGTPAPGPPYTSYYEIAPRFPSDILGHPGPVVTRTPFEDNISPTSVRINWETDIHATSLVLYGTSTYTDTVTGAGSTTSHAVALPGLVPATVYHYAIVSSDTNGTTQVGDFLFSTASPPGSTGQMNVFFSKTIDTSVAVGEKALGNQNLVSRVITRIDQARRSIDACFYNLSGPAGASIADALIAAKNRGIAVRVICEADNSTNAPFNTILSGGIPLITDAYDPSNNGIGLMHNKFVVVDGRGGAPESVWVWTGSWNPSDPGTNNDRQNAIEVQDVALAQAYTMEFNEMWGSGGQSPNASQSRFGSHKIDNTPHRFNIGGAMVECYFSPSDRTTGHIGKALGSAQQSICLCMYAFTRKELSDSMIVQKNRGRKVRGVMDNNSDLGTQFSYLQSNGVDVHLKGFSGGLLHHKYALVDAVQTGGVQWTITGSHNWSSSAENSNNENTLLIQNNRVTNLYLQEFSARYTEAGGADQIVLGVRQVGGATPLSYALSQNYPNPFNPTTKLSFDVSHTSFVSLKVYDVLGREVASLVDEVKPAGTYEATWDGRSAASGVYYYRLIAGSYVAIRMMVLAK